jgi:hypothetical protein
MDIPLEDILDQYINFHLAATSIRVSDKLDYSFHFQWDDPQTKIDKVFLYMHNKWQVHLLQNVVQPAVEMFTSKVIETMHLSCIRELLLTHTLLSVDRYRQNESVCCFCNKEATNEECVTFLPNPYLMWENDTNCSQPYATFYSRMKFRSDFPPKQTFVMHKGNASLLFAGWRLMHFNYFVDANLHSNKEADLKRVLLASIESCIHDRPACIPLGKKSCS